MFLTVRRWFQFLPLFTFTLVAIGAVTWTVTSDPSDPGAGVTVVLPASKELLDPSNATDASPPDTVPIVPSGAFGFSHYVFEKVGNEVVATLVEGPREGQVRSSLSYLQLKELYSQGGPIPRELGMSRDDLGRLVRQLDAVREASDKYGDVASALADGYIRQSNDVPNMGAHFTSVKRTTDGVFNPSEPEMLLYSKDESGEWNLTGTAFTLPIQQFGEDHPEAFDGPLDNWHVHYSLCTGSRVTSRSSTAEECKAAGGLWAPTFGWMIHAWVVVDNPLGVFSMWNPNVPPISPISDIRQARTSTPSEEDMVSLTIENFSFGETRLEAGQTVVWTSVDGVPHTVTSGSRGVAKDGFDSGFINPGQSFAIRFDKPGEYPYTCALHPYMNGTVIVTR